MSKPEVRIENWVIRIGRLHGDAYGHPRFKDGTGVSTSTIIDMPDDPAEGDIIETRNTLYRLGAKGVSDD